VIVPWPVAVEGWDEAIPLKIGTPDLRLGGYRVVHEVNAMVYLGQIADAGVRNYSAWSDVPRRPKAGLHLDEVFGGASLAPWLKGHKLPEGGA
jgi:hypothetical protein